MNKLPRRIKKCIDNNVRNDIIQMLTAYRRLQWEICTIYGYYKLLINLNPFHPKTLSSNNYHNFTTADNTMSKLNPSYIKSSSLKLWMAIFSIFLH